MIIKYRYGFVFEGVLFGWKDKKLFRLPQNIDKRYYPLRECGVYKNKKGIEKGFIVCRKRKSFDQLNSMTVFIDKEIQQIKDPECPF